MSKPRPSLPIGHIYSVEADSALVIAIQSLVATVALPICTNPHDFLDDLIFSATAYRNDVMADKARVKGIEEGLWAIEDNEGFSEQSWAAKQWLVKYGGKNKSIERARTALRKYKVQGRPPVYAKHMLACALCNALMKHTQGVSISTSRDNHDALTKDGALAQLVQGVLTIVNGAPLADPFPYLKAAVDSMESQ